MSRQLSILMMRQINISGLLRPFGPLPIGGWYLNLLGINILKLDSSGFMMLAQMGGMHRVSIGAAIERDGL
jgi:hypothetical protein